MNYHRFYVPVATRVGIATVRIVAEEKNNSDRLVPIDVSVYDVIINKRIPCTQPTDASASTAEDSFSRITLREMLRGVKGMDGKIYAQPMNAGVDLNQEVTGVVVTPTLADDDIPLVKTSGEVRKSFFDKIAGKYLNTDTQWEIFLSKKNIDHAIHTAMDTAKKCSQSWICNSIRGYCQNS